MNVKYLLPLMVLALVACDDRGKPDNPPIKPEPAKTTPPDAKFKDLKVETLSNEVRNLLGAKDERDVILVIKAKGGTVAYGAPGRGFTKIDKGVAEKHLAELERSGRKVEVVNQITIKTLRASPECDWYEDGFGNVFWYFEAPCPN